MVDPPAEQGRPALWVLEGTVSWPVDIAAGAPAGRSAKAFFVDLSGGSGDGFLQLQVSPEAPRAGGWWSPSEDHGLPFRASVLAEDVMHASLRARSFLETVWDRLMIVAGVPPSTLRLAQLYNEDELNECRAGRRSDYSLTPLGEPTREVGGVMNPWAVAVMRPNECAQRALRWFRKATGLVEAEDRFLAYYFSLECISNEIKKTAEETHRCKSCGGDSGIRKSQTEGIKVLVANHPEWDGVIKELGHLGFNSTLFHALGGTRAGLVHGGGAKAKQRAEFLEPYVQRLALDGIALSVGLDPKTVRMVDTRRLEMGLIALATFSADSDPSTRWDGPVRDFIARHAAPSDDRVDIHVKPAAKEQL